MTDAWWGGLFCAIGSVGAIGIEDHGPMSLGTCGVAGLIGWGLLMWHAEHHVR